jgi:hypothetical protein
MNIRRLLSLWSKANPPTGYTINPKKRGMSGVVRMNQFGIPKSEGADLMVDWAAHNGYSGDWLDAFLVFAGTPGEFRQAYLQNQWDNTNVQSYMVVNSEGHVQKPSDTGMTWIQCYSWLTKQPEGGWYVGGG